MQGKRDICRKCEIEKMTGKIFLIKISRSSKKVIAKNSFGFILANSVSVAFFVG